MLGASQPVTISYVVGSIVASITSVSHSPPTCGRRMRE